MKISVKNNKTILLREIQIHYDQVNADGTPALDADGNPDNGNYILRLTPDNIGAVPPATITPFIQAAYSNLING